MPCIVLTLGSTETAPMWSTGGQSVQSEHNRQRHSPHPPWNGMGYHGILEDYLGLSTPCF